MLPIEQKEYLTSDYHAVIQGIKPKLLSLKLYANSTIVTNTEIKTVQSRPRFGVGIHAGFGISDKQFQPYIGIGVQYNLFLF